MADTTTTTDNAPTSPVPLDSIPISPTANGVTDATNGSSTTTTNGTNGSHDKIVTVFDDPANFNVKHALQNTWTLWFTKPPSGKQDWNELLKEVISFDSVEEFWGIYVCLPFTSLHLPPCSPTPPLPHLHLHLPSSPLT